MPSASQGLRKPNVGHGSSLVIHARFSDGGDHATLAGAAPGGGISHDGRGLLDEYERLLGPRTRIVSITRVSNALGTILPVREMVAMAQRMRSGRAHAWP
jgi:aminotransferase class V